MCCGCYLFFEHEVALCLTHGLPMFGKAYGKQTCFPICEEGLSFHMADPCAWGTQNRAPWGLVEGPYANSDIWENSGWGSFFQQIYIEHLLCAGTFCLQKALPGDCLNSGWGVMGALDIISRLRPQYVDIVMSSWPLPDTHASCHILTEMMDLRIN